MKCCVCNREREPAQVIELTEEEKLVLRKAVMEPILDSYAYCGPCWAVMSDKNQGAQLFKGLMQVNLTRFGVRNAGTVAQRYYQFLIERATKKPTS